MATIDYKEKYDQAMERARQFFERPYLEDSAGIVGHIFPELKESEDERIRKDLITFLDDIWHLGKNANFDKWSKADCYNWLAWLEKQSKDSPVFSNSSNIGKIEQKLIEWSEEDEEMFDAIIADIQFTQKAHNHEVDQVVYEREIDWLKSFKDRYTWKPSDEQMEYLAKAITTLGDEGNCKTASILNYLRVELKKLRGE